MRNSNVILNIIFGVAIIVLFVLYVKKPSTKTVAPAQSASLTTVDTTADGKVVPSTSFPIAYVIVDSVMHNYLYYQKLQKQYQNMVSAEDAKLQRKAEMFQKDVQEYQYQVENRIITSANAQTKEAELSQRQQNLYAEQQSKQQELSEKEQKLLEQLIDSVHECIKFYNADGKYKIILNNAYQSSVLYAEDDLNVTNQVLEVMNNRYKASLEAANKAKK